jgi:hypothetical protein
MVSVRAETAVSASLFGAPEVCQTSGNAEVVPEPDETGGGGLIRDETAGT